MVENLEKYFTNLENIEDTLDKYGVAIIPSLLDENECNNMIDDIVGSFQNILNNKSNPFDNIMNITTMISDKYKIKLRI